MAFINPRTKQIQVKIIYWGPASAGKTACLIYIYQHLKRQVSAQLMTINAYGDHTLFFDFLPFSLGHIGGFDIKVRLYSVPGKAQYDAIRRMLLKGVDGIVFVADASAMRKANVLSLKNLQTHLEANRLDIQKVPLVLQFNKADLAEQGVMVLPDTILLGDLNSGLRRPYFRSSAVSGLNVLAGLKKIVTMSIASIEGRVR
jgi:mutual gliding-motility protein MglA